MAEPKPHWVTPDHYMAFGMIVNIVAEMEGLLDEVIFAITKADHTILPLLTFLSGKDKRDYILAMAKESQWPPYLVKGMEGLLDRIKKAADLRNDVAHSSWSEGRKQGTIKLAKLSARGTLRMVGVGHNEKEWTAAELKAEALKFQALGRDLLMFMRQYGLVVNIPKKTSDTIPNNSESDGG